MIASPLKWGGNDAYQLSFEKEGYLDKEIHPKAADPKGFSVTLEPQPVLVGQVLAPTAGPSRVTWLLRPSAESRQRIAAGSRRRTSTTPRDASGCRSIRATTGTTWARCGSASNRPPSRSGIPPSIFGKARPRSRHGLAPGVSANGSVAGRKSLNGTISVTLLPCRTQKQETASSDDLSQRQEMGRLKAAVDADGTFRFDHAAPGNYQLSDRRAGDLTHRFGCERFQRGR